MRTLIFILPAFFFLAAEPAFAQETDLEALIKKANDEIFHQHHFDYIDEVFAADYRNEGAQGQGPQLIHGFVRSFLDAFPDIRVRIENVIQDGEWVAWRRLHTATHKGPVMGYPATGKKLEWEDTNMSRIVDGKIVYETGTSNLLEKLMEAQDPEEEGDHLMQLSRDWSDLVPSGDLDAIMASWAEDAVMMPPDSPPLRGKDKIREYVAYFMDLPGSHIEWEPLEAHVARAGDMAYLIERNLVSFADEAGNTMTQPNKTVTVWRKNAAGEWENVIDMWNTVPKDE